MTYTQTYGLTHLALAVTDLERTRLFYEKVFGMQAMYNTESFIQLNTPGCYDIIVFELKEKSSAVDTGGIAHFGFRLRNANDIDAMKEKVISAGGMITEQGEFVPGSPYIFFKDPDGYLVEIWYEYI